VPALVRANRRMRTRCIEAEVVSARDSCAIDARRGRSRRPPDTIDASVPESISRYSQIDEPAAHEVPLTPKSYRPPLSSNLFPAVHSQQSSMQSQPRPDQKSSPHLSQSNYTR